jgi:hypothetical protein
VRRDSAIGSGAGDRVSSMAGRRLAGLRPVLICQIPGRVQNEAGCAVGELIPQVVVGSRTETLCRWLPGKRDSRGRTEHPGRSLRGCAALIVAIAWQLCRLRDAWPQSGARPARRSRINQPMRRIGREHCRAHWHHCRVLQDPGQTASALRASTLGSPASRNKWRTHRFPLPATPDPCDPGGGHLKRDHEAVHLGHPHYRACRSCHRFLRAALSTAAFEHIALTDQSW